MAELRDKFEAANVIAMWDQELRPNLPLVPSHIWRWKDVNPLIGEAANAVTMEDAERRVLILRNPGLKGPASGAAPNLSVNLQVLMPGEKARPHRHTMHALRFVLEGKGAVTIVEGKPCPMLPGDLILTPGMTWHEHVNDTNERSVWVDSLDVPIHGFLENRVFEPGPVRNMTALPADAVYAAGLSPARPMPPTSWSPMFRYPWDAAVMALEATPADADGARRLRYTNPTTGGAVLSTIDCHLLGLSKGAETTAYRTNSNAACVVVEGEGQSRIGDDTIAWGPKDIFTLPHGQWISHRASSDRARIFQITDRELFRRLDFLRDETRH
ncbi:MAG TPA: cupin domain-containing protein [Stellaceae bacterium]|nr:cupin domain-containing protein [Stellaceae bacterium]